MSEKKIGWINPCDIVLALEVSKSNALLIDCIKEKILSLFKNLDETELEEKCRWRLVTFGDVETEGSDAIDNSNPFVTSRKELEYQFESIDYQRNNNKLVSVLDTLYVVSNNTGWRKILSPAGTCPQGDAYRVIILITDSLPSEKIHAISIRGGLKEGNYIKTGPK